MADGGNPTLPLFPIQLSKVDIGEIAYSCSAFSDSKIQPASKFNLNVQVAPYDTTNKALQVALTFDAKSETEIAKVDYAYSLKITVHGQFLVEEERLPFAPAEMKKWAEKNGVIILLPFLRESVYTISQKTGFSPMMIPMIEVSAFRVGAPNHIQAIQFSPSTGGQAGS